MSRIIFENTNIINLFNDGKKNLFLIDLGIYSLLGDDKLYDKKEALDLITESFIEYNVKNIEYLFSRLIGCCILVCEYEEKLIVINSSTSPGIFYKIEADNILLSIDENHILNTNSNLDINGVLSAIMFHQGLIRDALNTCKSKIKYLPSGCLLEYRYEERLLKYDFYLANHEKSKYSFNDLIEIIIKSYCKNIKDLFLAKSGGVDSTVLASAYAKNKMKNRKAIHLPYYGYNTPFANTAKKICKTLNINFEFAKNDKSNVNLTSNTGLGVVIGSEYNKCSFNYLTKNYTNPHIITGQNLDSLYMIDSFAPASNEQGLIRLIIIAFTFVKRLMYNGSVINYISKIHKLRLYYIKTFLNGFNEHRAPIISTEITKKYKDTFDLFEYRNRSYNCYLNDQQALNKNIRSLKYLKFIHNTHRNYYNSFLINNIRRLTPFSEAPFVLFFLNMKLTISDSLKIKILCYNYLKDNGIDYNAIAKVYSRNTLYYIMRRIYFLLPKIVIKLINTKILKLNSEYFKYLNDSDIETLKKFKTFLLKEGLTEKSYYIGYVSKIMNSGYLERDDQRFISRVKQIMPYLNV